MRHSIKAVMLVAFFICTENILYAQKDEIKAFEKQNKEMLKQIKKQYKLNQEVKISQVGASYIEQKDEIKAFEKQNKEMLKQIKEQYKLKPEVKMTQVGAFYMVLKKREYKNEPEKFLLLDDTGTQLYTDWLDGYNETGGGDLFVCRTDGSSTKWGVLDMKGTLILPISFDKIWYIEKEDAGEYKGTYITHWHPAIKSCFVAQDTINHNNKFYSADGKEVLHEYDGVLEIFENYFCTISPAGVPSNGNNKGLLTIDGEEIFNQEYCGFSIGRNGFVTCNKKSAEGVILHGGKLINGELPDMLVPPLFCDLVYNESTMTFKCRMHRDDSLEDYDPQKQYEITYKDKGELLYDMGKYQDVITYYEGEGYGTVHGDYYMGLAANEIASTEMSKMNRAINTLNSETNYYLPIVYPDNYKFDAVAISTMYLSASVYLEKYINNSQVDADDPTSVKAKKLRGEIITAKNNVTKNIEEYGAALKRAAIKNVEREQAIAAQRAQQEAAASQLATGITNLIFGGSKKK